MNELNFERKMATIFKKRILISAIMSVMVLTAIADEYTDPQTNVVYTYEPGQSTASVKAGYYGGTGMNIDLCPGSPDAAGDVVILDKFTVGTAEYVVTSIGESAFWYNKNIKSVNIPESVTDIGVEAFKCCDGLTAVQLPEGLKRIPREIFLDCRKLESVGIPSSVRAIDEQAFSNCISLASLNLPAGLNYIGRYAFQNTPWYSTQYNEAPNGLFYIGPLLVGYKGDVPTGELVIKEGTTCIGYQAFNYCTGLTSVTIPKSLTHVDYRAFYNCVGLTAVHITDLAAWCKIEFQWDDASCSSNPLFNAHHLYLNGEEVTDLVIPDGVTSIGRYSFDNCTGLTSVTIPEGVTRICSNAFRSCSNLTSVTIPPSVTIIESMPFLWCKNLAVHISDLAAWCSISFQAASDVFYHDARLYLNGEEVKDLVIPDGVASIGSWSFMNCSYLTSVTIPESVTKIGEAAFYECSSLTDVYCYADNVPTTRYDAFKENLIASATLHVPAGSIDLYKTTSPWSEFGNIVAIMPIEINETTFPDDEFRNWVLAQSYGQDGVLTEEEIAGVTTINVMAKRIQSLKGIEYFTELTTLDCTGNQLTELDVTKCIKLTDLKCIWNQLATLDVSKNTALTTLSCSGNQLTTFDVSQNTTLETLGCGINLLTSLDVSQNTMLTELHCQENQLTELDVSKNILLKNLSCYDNQLTSINISGHTALESLRCAGNNLTELDVSGCPALNELICMNNQIRGEAMDALVESLPTVDRGHLGVINHIDEQNVMTKSQVAAAKAKGWYVQYNNDRNQWKNYEGSDDPVTFTEGQMATIILPTEPDASKGKYYKLDKCEDGQIIFEQELQPQARIPYIIIPNEDFSIDPSTMDLEGLSHDAVSIEGISFIGSYSHEEFSYQEGFYIDIIDTTPDCLDDWFGSGKAIVGPLRAYLQVNWDDPYTQGGTKDPQKVLEIVLKDHGTGINEIQDSKLKIQNEGAIFDLQGRRISTSQPFNFSTFPKGVYIFNGKKVLR